MKPGAEGEELKDFSFLFTPEAVGGLQDVAGSTGTGTSKNGRLKCLLLEEGKLRHRAPGTEMLLSCST